MSGLGSPDLQLSSKAWAWTSGSTTAGKWPPIFPSCVVVSRLSLCLQPFDIPSRPLHLAPLLVGHNALNQPWSSWVIAFSLGMQVAIRRGKGIGVGSYFFTDGIAKAKLVIGVSQRFSLNAGKFCQALFMNTKGSRARHLSLILAALRSS